jgi:hypothetical protein
MKRLMCRPRPAAVSRPLVAAALALAAAGAAQAQTQPVTTCDATGIGATLLQADAPVTILSAEPALATGGGKSVGYCLVKVRIPQAINIWVGLPLGTSWNGRWQSLGGGGYAGQVSAPTAAVLDGYAGATTDTGHTGGSGTFGMLEPGKPNVPLQVDFAYRSVHLMAVIGKQLVQAFYGRAPEYAYWNGCSTGGRQGLRMAQDFPGDYDGILAGAPAVHWDRFQAGQIWYQVVQRMENGGPIGNGTSPVLVAKEALATSRAVAACDALDGVTDGVLTDPRACTYSAAADTTITSGACSTSDTGCLTPTEARAIDKMWQGPSSCAAGHAGVDCPVRDVATRQLNGAGNKRLWYANTRGTPLNSLGGLNPFSIAVAQPRYWVYFDPNWDWQTLNYDNYLQFFRDTVEQVGPVMASDNPDLSAFRDRGGKVVMWHGWADPLIVPEGTIDYYDAVTKRLGGGYDRTRQFARLFMAPGVGHCSGGAGPQPQGLFQAVVDWVEKDRAPDTITASKPVAGGGTQTRPLCMYPEVAKYVGRGSTDDAANFVCSRP